LIKQAQFYSQFIDKTGTVIGPIIDKTGAILELYKYFFKYFQRIRETKTLFFK
jgi:hypothetical protein